MFINCCCCCCWSVACCCCCCCCLSSRKMIEELHMKMRSNWDWWLAWTGSGLAVGCCLWAARRGRATTVVIIAVAAVIVVVVVVVVICRAILHLSRLLHENYKTTGNRFYICVGCRCCWQRGEGQRGTCQRQQNCVANCGKAACGEGHGAVTGTVSSWHDACAASECQARGIHDQWLCTHATSDRITTTHGNNSATRQ